MFDQISKGRCVLVAAVACVLLTATAAPADVGDLQTLAVLDGEAAGDQFGAWISTSGDFNGDGYQDVVVAASLNTAAGSYAGRAYLYLGGPGFDATPDLVLTGSGPGARLGVAAAVGDVNNDGFEDFVVGAPGNSGQIPGPYTPGNAYLHFGGAVLDAVPDLIFTGENPGDVYGSNLAGLGDINADGHDDFVIAAPWWPNKTYRGKAYIYFGGPGLDNVADLTFSIPEGELGVGVCPGGDFTGDGHNDLLIGAYKRDMPAFDSGAAWLYMGGPGLDAVADFTFGGENHIDWFGSSLAWVGDLNNDGFNDLAMGASRYPSLGDWGRAYIFFGGPALDTTPDLVMTGEASGDYFRTVAGVGDVDYDGFADFLVGAFGNDDAGTDAGKAYLFLGGPGLDTFPDFAITGGTAGERFGVTAMGLGDVNGDSRPDFAVGAYHHDNQTGRVYVYSFAPVVVLDIKPGSCPNPLNLKPFQKEQKRFGKGSKHGDLAQGGVVPAAIVGTTSLDVTDVDPSTLLLEGVAPLRHDYEDVTAPPTADGECPCTREGADGHMDMTLKFQKASIAEVLDSHVDGDVVTLTLTGQLYDGTPIEATDCVVIRSHRSEMPPMPTPDFVLGPAVPNPFNPSTRITYILPRDAVVTLTVYDVAGRAVERLFTGAQTAGEHVVEWDATGHPSGVYFYRIEVGDFTETRRMILLK
jgi:hypothetical protein